MTSMCCTLSLVALVLDAEPPLFEDRFETGLKPGWQVVSGEPRILALSDNPDEHVLELPPSTKMMIRFAEPLQDLVMEAKVRFAERRGWVEAPFLIRSNGDGTQALQVYLEQTSNRVLAVRFDDGVKPLANAVPPVRLEIGPWYVLRVVAVGRRIGVWLDDHPVMGFVDDQPRSGMVGIRVGDARTQYDTLRVRATTPDDRRQLHLLSLSGRVVSEMQETALTPADGTNVTLLHPDVIEPLTPFEVKLKTRASGTFSLEVNGKTLPIRHGEPISLSFSGPEGLRRLQVARDGKVVGSAEVLLKGDTSFEAGPFTGLFNRMRERVREDRHAFRRKGKIIQTNPTWVRDHIHEMKAYKYWEQDLTSFVDTLIELQHPDGFFHEIIGEASHDHQTFVAPKFVRVEKEDDLCFIRLEMEADVEYLMVEAAQTIWQATGDLNAMKSRLAPMDKAIRYDFTDPTRWDAKHGALKRTFSIDTWDFTYGVPDTNRRIEPNMPMGIMHGDNSGLYQACRQLAGMHRAAGDAARADHWDKQAVALRDRVNRLCFNGRYYTHQILLQPVDTGVREADILSLSNPYDINRDLPTREMAVRIIDEYQARRKAREKTHFAEWFSVDPPYPKFGPYSAGQYINGGIAGFVAGELAKAAFDHGREAYGADILHRVARKVAEDGTVFFLYTTEGRDMGGGPRGGCAAAVISALIEGLAGIRDDEVAFRRVTVSPRFIAAGIDKAKVCARYGPSGAYVAMDYEHAPANRSIRLRLAGIAAKTHVRILLPAGSRNARVIGPPSLTDKLETVEQSQYITFDLPGGLSEGVFEASVQYGD